MNARWVQLLCMIYTFITNQYKSMASLKMSSSFSCLCCSVEVAANPLLATSAHAGHIDYMFPKPLTVCILCTFQGLLCMAKQFLSSVNFECGVVLEILISSINVHASTLVVARPGGVKGLFFRTPSLKSNFGADLSDGPRSRISGE